MSLSNAIAVVGIMAAVAGVLIGVISAMVAIVSVVFAWGIWNTAKKTLVHQILLNVQKDYRSGEMLYAIRTLWDFYRREGKEKFVDKYESIRKEDEQKILNLAPTKRLEAEQGTLHYMRRLVSHFYQHLASLYINGVLPRNILYTSWSEPDLKIIPDVLVPIENRLRRELSGSPPLDESSPLIILYRDSKKS